jgi:hypothetical protein
MAVAIIPICEHIKDNGIRCGTPALRGRKLCYYHDRDYRRHRIPKDAACKIVPVLRCRRDIRMATTNIVRAIRQGLFTPAEGKIMLYGLQIVRSTLNIPDGSPEEV